MFKKPLSSIILTLAFLFLFCTSPALEELQCFGLIAQLKVRDRTAEHKAIMTIELVAFISATNQAHAEEIANGLMKKNNMTKGDWGSALTPIPVELCKDPSSPHAPKKPLQKDRLL